MPKGVYPTNFGRKPGATWNPENRAKAYATPGRRLPGRQPGFPAPESQKQKLRAYWHAANVEERLRIGLRNAAVKRTTLVALEAYETLVDRDKRLAVEAV